jgi:hypothetical protein
MGDFVDKKRGQVTIFIIIAILVVAIGVLIYMLSPGIETGITGETKSPEQFIQTCLEEDIENTVEVLSLQGGSIEPEHYIIHQGETVEYLCYTNEYYRACVMQQPLLKQHIESEIKSDIEGVVKDCFDALWESYIGSGYSADLQEGSTKVELLPKRIVTSFTHVLTLTKGETETHDSFNIILNNNLYELVGITNSILESEALYGEAETTLYMNYYQDLKVEKLKKSDGSTVYILTDRNNGNKFQFASRSMVLPPGYRTS